MLGTGQRNVEGKDEYNVIPALGNLQPSRGHQPTPIVSKWAASAELPLRGRCLGEHPGERLALTEDIMEEFIGEVQSFDENLQSKY